MHTVVKIEGTKAKYYICSKGGGGLEIWAVNVCACTFTCTFGTKIVYGAEGAVRNSQNFAYVILVCPPICFK